MDDTFYLTLCNDGYNMLKNDMASLFEQLGFESEDDGWQALSDEWGISKDEFYLELGKFQKYNDDTWYYPDGLSMANGKIEEFMTGMTQEYISTDCMDHRRLITSTEGGGIL